MKPFLLRDIPDQLHSEWKFFSKKRGFSMRGYLLVALKMQVDKDKDKDARSTKDRQKK